MHASSSIPRAVKADADQEITVTVGGTEALFSAASCCIAPGDEAIVFDPAYDSYDPAVRLAGGRCIHVPLELPDFDMPWERLRAALSPRTRLVFLNNPHNPAGRVLERRDLDTLAQLLRGTNALLLSDEVYEHLVLDGRQHVSVLSHPELGPARLRRFRSARPSTRPGGGSAIAWRPLR